VNETQAEASVTTADAHYVTLKYPVKVKGVDYTALTLGRRLKVKDLLQADRQGGSAGEQEVIQFALMCGVAPDVIEELDAADYKALQNKAKAFLS